jgi:hypothetical protein
MKWNIQNLSANSSNVVSMISDVILMMMCFDLQADLQASCDSSSGFTELRCVLSVLLIKSYLSNTVGDSPASMIRSAYM